MVTQTSQLHATDTVAAAAPPHAPTRPGERTLLAARPLLAALLLAATAGASIARPAVPTAAPQPARAAQGPTIAPLVPRSRIEPTTISALTIEAGRQRVWVAAGERLVRVGRGEGDALEPGATWRDATWKASDPVTHMVAREGRLIAYRADGTLRSLATDGPFVPRLEAETPIPGTLSAMILVDDRLLMAMNGREVVARDVATLERRPFALELPQGGWIIGVAASERWLWVSWADENDEPTAPEGEPSFRSELLLFARTAGGAVEPRPVARLHVPGALRHLAAYDHRVVGGGERTGVIVAEARGPFGPRIVHRIEDFDGAGRRTIRGLVARPGLAVADIGGGSVQAYRTDARAAAVGEPWPAAGTPVLLGDDIYFAREATLALATLAERDAPQVHAQLPFDHGLGRPRFGLSHGHHLWAVGSDTVLRVYDLRAAGPPHLVTQHGIAVSTRAFARRGDTIWVVDGEGVVHAFDALRPRAAPRIAARSDIAQPMHVQLVGELLVIASDTELAVLGPDGGPILVEKKRFALDVQGMAADGAVVWISALGGLMWLDLTDPATPVLHASDLVPAGTGAAGRLLDIDVREGLLVGTVPAAGFVTIDVSTPEQARVLGQLDFPGFPVLVDMQGDTVAISTILGSGLHLVDVGEPRWPTEYARSVEGSLEGPFVFPVLSEGWLAALDLRGGLQVFDRPPAPDPRVVRSASPTSTTLPTPVATATPQRGPLPPPLHLPWLATGR